MLSWYQICNILLESSKILNKMFRIYSTQVILVGIKSTQFCDDLMLVTNLQSILHLLPGTQE